LLKEAFHSVEEFFMAGNQVRIAFFIRLVKSFENLQLANMTTISSTDSTTIKTSTAWWICAGLILAIFAAYWPVTGYSFTDYDDDNYVWQNPHILHGLSWSGVVWAFTNFYASNWHPLTWLSHMLDVQLYGMNAGRHHVTNVLLHTANTVLLFLWLRRATGFIWRSAMVAAVFGLHPLHVESVAWVAERKDVLSTFFLMLSLMAYTRYASPPKVQSPKSKALFYWLSLAFFALGLMSKPMLVTLPFVLLLLDFWPLQRFTIYDSRFTAFNLLFEKIPFFALSVISCILTFLAQQSGKSVMTITVMPIEIRIQNALISYWVYVKKMLWPDALAVCYPLNFPIDTDQAVTAIFMLLLISTGVFFFRRQRPYLVTGWLWYLGTLVPVIGLVQVGSQSMADRYTYVPLIGIFIALIWLVVEISTAWRYQRLVLALLSLCVLATCWKLTATQVRFWQNSEILSRHALAVTTDNAAMQVLLGNALLEQGKNEEAGQHFAEAVRIWPNVVAPEGDLALALVNQGRFDEVIDVCRTALKLQPNEPKIHYILALALVDQGKLDEAIDACRAALKLQPDEPKIHYLLGNTLSTQGKFDEAIAEYKTALQFDPDHLFALNDLAWLLATAPDARFRDGPEAVRLAEHACQISDYQVTLYVGTLAAAYAEAGRFDDAVKTAQKAIALATAAHNGNLVQKNHELLELYQHKRAYHEPASH
jgi:tetratricopeptide (TPR) repeat protein